MYNITIQELIDFLPIPCMMLCKVYMIPPYIPLLILRISFVLHIFSLKTLFDNRAKNEALLETIESLQTDNDQLKENFNTLEKETTNLTNKTQSNEALLEIIQSLHTDNDQLKEKFSRRRIQPI